MHAKTTLAKWPRWIGRVAQMDRWGGPDQSEGWPGSRGKGGPHRRNTQPGEVSSADGAGGGSHFSAAALEIRGQDSDVTATDEIRCAWDFAEKSA